MDDEDFFDNPPVNVETGEDNSSALVLVSAMGHTSVALMDKLNDNLDALSDQAIIDSYQATLNIDRASWLIRVRLANEAWNRVKAKVAARFKSGDTKKQDAECGTEIKNLCTALGVSYSQFMYDVRIWERMFDPLLDEVEGIQAAEMVSATEILTRSHFMEASDCKQPRAVIKEIVRLVTAGEQVSSKAVRAIKKALEAKQEGVEHDPEKEAKKAATLLVGIKEGEIATCHLELISGIENAARKVKAGEDQTLLISILKNGEQIRVSPNLPEPDTKSPITPVIVVQEDAVRISLVTKEGHFVMALTAQEREAVINMRSN